jgi:hypothetical protein
MFNRQTANFGWPVEEDYHENAKLLKISWKAIVLNKMRTFFTMLGIIIG